MTTLAPTEATMRLHAEETPPVREEAPPPASAWRRAGGVIRLLRPLNLVLFVAGVVVGGLLAAGPGAAADAWLWLAACSAALVGGGANSFNDLFDLDVDRVNRPGRPLPSGLLPPATARRVGLLASLAGVGLSLLLGEAHVVMAAGAVVLLYGYNARLKRTPVWGNLVVASVVALALIYGGWAVGAPAATLAGAAFAWLTTLAREITKDLEDMAGDAGAGARTLPLAGGPGAAAGLAAAVVVLTILLTPVPFLLLGYSSLFLFVVLGTDALLLRALWLLQADAAARAGRISRLLKAAMVVGLLALAVAGVGEPGMLGIW